MNIQTIDSLYNDIVQQSSGAKKIKVDLHIHTPASKDFVYKPLSIEDAYINILDNAIENNIEIIAITDHNTFKGYRKIKEILSDLSVSKKYKELTILCGIEITCFSKHLLAIFPSDFIEKEQDAFLRDIGIEDSVQGSENAIADNLGPALLINTIGKYNGFAILAHADSNKGFLQSLCGQKVSAGELDFDGKSLAKIIHQSDLLGFQCNSDKNRERILSNLKNKDYKRINPLAVLKCSDCHGIVLDGDYKGKSGLCIGSLYTDIKLSEKSFVALKMALIDLSMRICNNILDEYPFIEGVAINSSIFSDNNMYSYFHFNKELNCIIGSRGAGKSTLLEVIQSIISPNSLNQSTKNKAFDKYYEAVVYLNNGNHVYALYCKPKIEVDNYTGDKRYIHIPKFYYKSPTAKRFAKLIKLNEVEFLRLILTAGYQQQQLFEYSINPNKILDIVDDFINWKHHKEFRSLTKQIKYQHDQLDDLLKNIRKNRKELKKSFIEYITDSGDINTIVNIINIINNRNQELSKARLEMINELNHVLTGKVKLKLGKKLSDENWKEEISELATAVKQHRGKYHDYYVKINKNLQKIYKVSIWGEKFEFNILLLNSKFDEIIELYKLTEIGINELTSIRNVIDEDFLQIFLEDSLKMEYNINTGSNYSEKFMDNQKISMGQNAVALLLLILNASYALNDNRPLLMDQPEDDLDNSYIYSTLVKEFRNSKKKRQVIISTHNPNIPVAADAENIMVLKYNGTHSYLDSSGSIDSSVTAKAVLETMEGGQEAIQRRMDKYNIINLD